MKRKYELTDNTAEFDGVTLHQIRALRALPYAEISVGDYGGFVERDGNLDHRGQCWVYGVEGSIQRSAVVLGDAVVTGDCRIHDNGVVAGRARVAGTTLVYDSSQIIDDADVELESTVSGGAVIFGSARICTGQDGPYIVPGSAIDFDVAYGNSYITLGAADGPWMFSVSRSGRISEAGSWGRERWSGDLAGMRSIVADNPHDDALPALLAAAEAYLD